ncbi:PAS domain S-box protein [Parabacteroides acidifaciens]|uniref:histidine kinase n=1 Tax=Parabacteroides acidifaciens TaxID=2290935 RepID=A0A3D8HGI7_9BACT|nr:ATP-binding protein [Parabacteroides acidifaciens]MBC8601216.1 PAS domain S-box protein [Parabacteroides acidifaciens]RDU50083.1 PAS domain S-box protein [Parabacteroides acidifaciens]
MNTYEYTREDLIEENISSSKVLVNTIALRRTISDVLTLLLSANDNAAIDNALLSILRFFEVERVYIGIFDETCSVVDFTHEVTSDGIISMREDILRQLTDEDIPWWIEQIKTGKDIIIFDTAKMPEEAATEQHMLKLQEVLSLLALPVSSAGKICGFIGLDSVRRHRTWNALDIENLRILADIVSIAIEREHDKHVMEHSANLMLKSEVKFRIIFEKLPWGVELYDADGTMLDLNDADLEIFGTTRENVIGVNMFRNPNIPEWVNQKLKKGEDVTFTLDYNFHIVREEGYYSTSIEDETKHLLVKGVALKDIQNKIFGYLYIVFDNSEDHHKTEQIEYNLIKLRTAVDTGESFIWEYDTAKQTFSVDLSLNKNIDKNPALSYLKKHQPRTLEDFISTLHPDDVDKIYNRKLKRLMNGEIDNYIAIYRRILGGKQFWFNSNVRSYKFNEDGTPSKIISYTSNITEQREKENELIRVKEADKLKSAFLANMSHEIRTPLNAIVGFSDIVAETSDEEERKEYLEIIHKNNDLLLHLIDDILDFSRIESGTFDYHITETDIKEICGEVFLASSLKMKPGVTLVFDKDLPSIRLKTDPQRIMQVVSNFVNNAIKFTEEGSITISYKKEGNNLRVSVQDTGIGISEKDRSRIFERFIKINEFKQGTGLGLTISKTIIENLQGTIGVDSVQGSGSTFWFSLPLTF